MNNTQRNFALIGAAGYIGRCPLAAARRLCPPLPVKPGIVRLRTFPEAAEETVRQK